GTELLRDYCTSRNVVYDECGKLVVAHTPAEEALLHNILARARANGVPGVELVDQDRMRELEPHSKGVAAVHSPHTAIVDYPGVTRALLADVAESGGAIRYETHVTRVQSTAHGQVVHTDTGEEQFDFVVVCSGLQSDRLSQASGLGKYPV